MIDSKDISVVIQGAIDPMETKKCISSIKQHLPGAEIILSTWENSNLEGLEYDHLVLNNDPGAFFCNRAKTIKNNLNRQIISTQNGLKQATRKYVLKLRSDLILTSNKFLKHYNSYPKKSVKYSVFNSKIIASSLFSRDFVFCIYRKEIVKTPVSISDWWFFGENNDIKKLFSLDIVDEPHYSTYFQEANIPDDYIWQFAPEQYIGKHVLKLLNLDYLIKNQYDYSEYLLKISRIILISNFIFLGFNESGIYNRKYLPYSQDERLFDYHQYPGLITYYKFLKFYKKYLSKTYRIPKSVKEYYKLREYHYSNFKTIHSKDISVVIQGAINPTETKKCISSIRHKLPQAEIILSTWEGSNLEGLEYDKLILNKDPGAIPITKKIMNNMNRQLLSTQNGLKVAERKYVLKLRSDLILANTNFLKYFNKFLARTDDYKLFERKILTCTLLTRHKIKHEKGFIDIPFHVSDWWFFGLRTDINTLFKDTPLVEEPYFTKYFEQDEHKNKFNPFLGARFQFAPEQYFVYKCFERNFKDIHMEDASDWNENTIEQSKKVIINNFIVLEHKQSGIFLNKYAYSKNELFSGEQYLGLYGFDFYQKEYQKYCDSNYVIKKKLNVYKNEEFYIDYFRLNKHIYKLFHEKCSILSKLEQIFFSIPFRSFILILNQLKKMLQITP